VDSEIAVAGSIIGSITGFISGTPGGIGTYSTDAANRGSATISSVDNLALVQAYAASGTWAGGDTTITMAGSPGANVPSGKCLVYDYDRMLYGDGTIPNIYTIALGVGTWSGTTVTFTSGVSQGSHTSADRLIFAPIAGAVRMSSTVGGGVVRNCGISGFIGVTTSEDNYNSSGQQQGAEGFSITVENCNIPPAGHAAAIGGTGMYLTNNSLSKCNDLANFWMGYRLSGLGLSILTLRCEVCTYGICMQAEQDTGNLVATACTISGGTLESHVFGILALGGTANVISGINILCQDNRGQYGVYLSGGNTVIQGASIQGNWAGYALYMADVGNSPAQNVIQSVTAANHYVSGLGGWRIPAQSWWGTCIESNNPALVYTYANLKGVSTNPVAVEGNEYNISDSTVNTWGTNVTVGGGSNHVKVRYNGTNWTLMGK
jgi:hypothetical protein